VVSHLGNFAHNIGQRIVLNHANVYNEALRGGIHGYILLTIEFYVHIHNCAFDRFILPRAINNHEWTILSKIRDSDSVPNNRIRNSFYRNMRTCRRESIICFYRNPDSYHRTDNILSSIKSSRCLIFNG